MRFRAVLVCLVPVVLSCTSAAGDRRAGDIPADELLAGNVLETARAASVPVDDAEVLAVSDEMRAFVDEHVDRRAGASVKLQDLVDAMIDEGSFGLEYDESTRTAAETFRLRRGNCLSFSNLFVALAREAGLEAQFQEVDIPPDWTLRNDAFVLNRHVNVSIDLGSAGRHGVDFNIDDFRSTYDRRLIPDARALAHYSNNLGVEAMQAGDAATALAYYRRAIADNHNRFAAAWTNLGVLYLREGHPAHAEAAFLQALKVDPGHDVAMSNLVGLYEQQGDLERAGDYRKQVMRHRNKNPYYRYQLAREAYLGRDYDTAVKHLKHAIRAREQEDRFYFLLGLCHMQRGDEAAARRWLIRAEEIAAGDGLKRTYANKIDMLLSRSAN